MNNELLDYFNEDKTAADQWLKKYAADGEKTPDDMHRRMAKEFARIEKNYKGVTSITDRLKMSIYGQNLLHDSFTEDRIYNLFKDFKYVVPQGSVMAVLGTGILGSLSQCFVIGQPEDSYGGIMQKDEQLVQLMKRRGGVGMDVSTLRPFGTDVHNSAKTSTGVNSFTHRFSNTTNEVAQDGRRGALMISCDVRHPDIFEFAGSKQEEGVLSGANISVMLRDDFMEAVEADGDYMLRFPCNEEPSAILDIDGPDSGKLEVGFMESWDIPDMEYKKLYTLSKGRFIKKIKAKELYDWIVKNARDKAEPGQLFINRHWAYSPDGVYRQYIGITCNPCGEIFMQMYDACRLIALNFFSFVKKPFTSESQIDFKKLYEIAYEAMRLSDDLVDLELENIGKIIEKVANDPQPDDVKRTELDLWKNVYKTAKASRRTGLGFTALGDTLAALNFPYDSEGAKQITEDIMHTKMEAELDCTIDMAIERGTFEEWDKDEEYPYNSNDEDRQDGNKFYTFLKDEFPDQQIRMYKYGRRNVSWSTVAPTGTVSLMTGTTSGLEPLFLPWYMRKVKINPGDTDRRVDSVDESGNSWTHYYVLHPKFKDWMRLNINFKTDLDGENLNQKGVQEVCFLDWLKNLSEEELQNIFEKSPWFGSTANELDWIKRLELQQVIQRYTTHSISCTINLPETVTAEEVGKIYMEAWRLGLKGITVYREGSRKGVLVSTKKSFEYHDAPIKRPKEIPHTVHIITVNNKKWNVFMGTYEGKPFEIFVVPYFTTKTDCIIRKIRSKRYDMIIEGSTYSENITTENDSHEEVLCRTVSLGFRHGIHPKFFVEQFSHGDMNSFAKVLSRIIKKFISNGEKSTLKCSECGSKDIIFQEGCSTCTSCGSSVC